MVTLLAAVCRLVQACRWIREEWPWREEPLLMEQKRAAFKVEPKRKVLHMNLIQWRSGGGQDARRKAS